MQAVIDGDTETAQMMVEGAAAAAGLKGPYYHGTPHGGFTVFDGSRNGKRGSFASSQLGFFFTEDIEYADGLAHSGGTEEGTANGLLCSSFCS